MSSTVPPAAKKLEHVMELFGDVRVDHHYWLRDDSRSHSDVISHLQQENVYTNSFMSGTKQFEEKLFNEMKRRIKEDDISAPRRKGAYYYYTRTLEGKEYVQHCRRYISNNEVALSVHDVMPTGPNDPPEHVIFDENVKAQGNEYYSIDAFEVSPNHKMVAYAEDTKGDEIYTVHIIDADTGAPVGNPLAGLTSSLEWAGNEFLVYTTMDEVHRACKVWLHKLGTDQSNDCCLYHETDDRFCLTVEASEDEKYLFIACDSQNTGSVLYIDAYNPEDGAKALLPRIDDVDISISHRGNHFFIQRRTAELFNTELLACPVDNISATTVLIPHRESIKISEIQLFADHLVICERENGLPKITTYRLPAIDEPLTRLEGGQTVDFIDPVYSVYLKESEFSSFIMRFTYSSPRIPQTVYEYDMNTGVCIQKKTKAVLGGFDSSNYIAERKWATASDGTQIPMSVVYRKDIVKFDGSHPLLLYGYGSYEMSEDPTFDMSMLSLLDRGFIYVVAHVRGGGELGRQWYENGKLMKKKNTFTDFIICAEYLIEQKYCSKEKLCIEGRSAGGLLIGAVLNMRPDLFKAAVAEVPFVDVLTTMLDPSIHLTTEEWEEWGDPRKEEFYFYIKSYSPVDNIKPQNYPNILVTAGLHDPRVMFSEPAKYVAKLRNMKTGDNVVLFKCDLCAGHSSKSGRFERLQEDAFKYTFLLKILNMIPDIDPPSN